MTKEELIKYVETNSLNTYQYKGLPPNLKSDKELILLILKQNPTIYSELNDNFRNNPEILNIALQDKTIFDNPVRYALPGALTEENINLALEGRKIATYEFSETMLSSKEFILKYLEKNSGYDLYRRLSNEFKNDIDIVKALVKNNGHLFGDLSPQFRNDPEILKSALQDKDVLTNPIIHALPGALTEENINLALEGSKIATYEFSETMLSSKEFILKYLEKNSGYDLYRRLSNEFKNDIDIVKALVKNNGHLLGDLSPQFRDDPEILKSALQEKDVLTNPIIHALPNALTEETITLAIEKGRISASSFSETMLSSKEFILKYLEKNSGYDLYRRLSNEFKNDIDIVKALVKNNGHLFGDLSPQFRDDPEILKSALQEKDVLTNPIIHALPNALTEETITLAIEKGRISASSFSETLLSNKEFILRYIEKYYSSELYGKLSNEFQNDIDIVKAFVRKVGYLFSRLPEKFRNDPEVLKEALQNTDAFTNPIIYALPEALTEENMDLALEEGSIRVRDFSEAMLSNKIFILKYLEKNSGSDLYEKLSNNFQNDKDIIKALIRNNSYIFQKLPEDLRKDPEMLKSALQDKNIRFANPIIYALPEALTKENIDLAISIGKIPWQGIILDNKYFILKMMEKDPEIFSHASERIRSDPEVIQSALLFEPKLLYNVGSTALTDEMIEYATQRGLEINENTITNAILSSEVFVRKFLPIYPSLYKKLPEELKNKVEFINITLSQDANNLYHVPEPLIADDMISYALNNGYTTTKDYNINDSQIGLITNYLNRKIETNPNEIFEHFINTTDKNIALIIMQIIKKKKIEDVPSHIKDKGDRIINEYIKKYQNCGFDMKDISTFINKVLAGERSVFNLNIVYELKTLLYVINIDDLDTHGNLNEFIKNISYDALTKINIRHYNDIKRMLQNQNIDEINSKKLALSIYMTIGYQRARDLLNANAKKNYGPVDLDKLEHLFGNIDLSEVMFKEENNKYVPIINEQLVNLLFGANYKVANTPIRNFLNGFGEMEAYVNGEIRKVSDNTDLTEEDKQSKISSLKESLTKYCTDTRSFISSLNTIFNKWDVIEEEFLKKQSLSKLKIKLNISQINQIVKSLSQIRKTTMEKKKLSTKHHKRYSRIPNYQPRDYPLVKSDVFDYVGIQTQFTSNPEQAPARAVVLSRMMENKVTKKFPNVNLDFGEYSIKVFNPQDRNLISAGFRSGCCFRPNGNADNSGHNNSLLTYCCTTEYGGGLEIHDKNGKTLMFSPVLRNGNVLMLHSFETLGLTDTEKEIANEILKIWSKEVLKVSQEEEQDNPLVAVTMTDLHPSFDTTKCDAVLPRNKNFTVYDPERKYIGMYHNLDGRNHYVISFAKNKHIWHIKYNVEVKTSYQYPVDLEEVKVVTVNEEEQALIKQIIDTRNDITILANKRAKLLRNKEEIMGFEVLRTIKEKQKETLIAQKRLYSLNPNSRRDTLTEYLEAVEVVNSICDELKVPRDAYNRAFVQIYYTEGWYLGITKDNKLYGNCIKGFESQYFNALNEMKRNYDLDLELDVDNKNIIGGGYKK